MNFQNDLDNYIKYCKQKTELREIRKFLLNSLRLLEEKLDVMPGKPKTTKFRCPYCRSNYTKGHGRKPFRRLRCLDCGKTFQESLSRVYYRKRNRIKILDLLVAVHTTNKTITQIIQELKISIKTYHKWEKDLIFIFPQLEEKFTQRRVKSR